MSKKFFLGAALTAVVLFGSNLESKASSVLGFYSLNGSAIAALPDLDGNTTNSTFAFFGPIGNFDFNLVSAFGQPNAGLNLLSVTANNSHTGTGTDTLKLYFVAAGLGPGGNLDFTSQFSSNAQGGGLPLLASTYLGSPTTPGTVLGTATFPPLLGTVSSLSSTFVASGFTLTGELDITATGSQNSNSGITVSAVPVPSPVLGAGLPGLLMACGGLFALARRRRRIAL